MELKEKTECRMKKESMKQHTYRPETGAPTA